MDRGIRWLLLVSFIAFCPFLSSAQVKVIGWDVPSPPTLNYTTYVVQNIDGVTLALDGTTADTRTSCVFPCSLPSFSVGLGTFDTNDINPWAMKTCGAMLRGSGFFCNTNIVVRHVSDGGNNTATPPYLYSQDWADTACQASTNDWTANTNYPMGWCVVPQTGFTSDYYVMSGTPSSGVCNSGSSPPSSWPTGGSSTTTDGGGCVWKDHGVHAPLLDVAIGADYPGGLPANGAVWTSGKSYSAVANAIITCGATPPASCLTHYYQEQADASCTSGSSAPVWPTNLTSVTDGSGGTACHWTDIGTDNHLVPFNAGTNSQTDTLTVLASCFPAIWETPFAYWAGLLNASVENHYVTSSFPTVKYIRIGVSLGGEASTTLAKVLEHFAYGPANDTQLMGVWTNLATQSYLANAATRAGITPTVPSWYLLGSLNCGTGLTGTPSVDCSWADAEARGILAADAAYGQVYGYGTQGLQNNSSQSDLVNIQNGSSCVGSACCSNNWCEVRNYTIGHVPIIQLQECNISTPAGGTMACLNNQDSPYNPAVTLEQVFNLATQHGTTVMEIYGDDLQCAFVTGFVGAATNGCQSNPVAGYGHVYQRYASAIQNLANGVPNATTTVLGTVQIQGGATAK